MAIKKFLEQLSANEGGSLVNEIKLEELTKDSRVLMIGLGGMGCRTINKIKTTYLKEFRQDVEEKIEFLAVDTSDDDVNDLLVSSGGSLELEETFTVFDPTTIRLLLDRPPEIETWCSERLPREIIDLRGAKQTRQIGRVMLCGSSKYSTLRNIIKGKIDAMMGKDNSLTVTVVIVAGISGGTGSGTFIDVSYMVTMLREEYSRNQKNIEVWGTFYTPDVQKNVPAIASDHSAWCNLQRNGYAALKELDYYMTNGVKASGKNVYSINVPGKGTLETSWPIFDQGKVFIITPNAALNDAETIIDATSRVLLNMFKLSQVTTGASKPQSILSNYSNANALFETWRNKRCGKPINKDINDPCKVENTEYPVSMNYLYSTIGHSSVYFPRDEIIAYCANRVLQKIVEKWTNINHLSQKYIDLAMKSFGVYDVSYLLKNIRIIAEYSDEKLKIKKDSTEPADKEAYPTAIGAFGFGKATGLKKTIARAEEIALEAYNSLIATYSSSPQILANKIAAPIKAKLESKGFLESDGPFVAIAILTGYNDINGICDRLAEIKADLPTFKKSVDLNLQQKTKKMNDAKETLSSDPTPTDSEIELFVNTCRDYSIALLEKKIFDGLLKNVLIYLDNALRDFNNRTFELYVPVIKALIDCVQKDSNAIADPQHHKYANGDQTFALDVYKLQEVAARNKLFTDVFDKYVDKTQTDTYVSRFVNAVFGEEAKTKWSTYTTNPNFLAEQVRIAFRESFEPLTKDMLEKFMILVYAPDEHLKNIDATRLTEIWNAAQGTTEASIRDNAITSAGKNIAEILETSGSLLYLAEASDTQQSDMETKRYVLLLEETPILNQAIESNMKPGTTFCTVPSDRKAVVHCISYSCPVSIAMVRNIADWADEYFKAATIPGKHLDEKGQNWVKYLPEIYGVDTERYYTLEKKMTGHDLNQKNGNDAMVYAEIKEAVDFGLQQGYIYECAEDANNKHYNMIKVSGASGYGSLYEACKASPHKNFEAWVDDAIKDKHEISKDIVVLSTENDVLRANITAKSDDPDKLTNLYRAIRSNMNLTKEVIQTYNYYKNSKIFDEISIIKGNFGQKALYESRISLFTDLLIYNLIRHDEEQYRWEYTFEVIADGVTEKDVTWHTFYDHAAREVDMDITLGLFLAFSSFCLNVDEENISALETVVASLLRRRDLISPCTEIIDLCGQVTAGKYFPKIAISSSYEHIRDQYKNSQYKNLYNFPEKVGDDMAVICSNAKTFYDTLKKDLTTKIG